MKRFYYEVGDFKKESEAQLPFEQFDNDAELIRFFLYKWKLDPVYPEEDRIEGDIPYTGLLGNDLFNWKGNKLEWIDHTIGLFVKEYNSFLRRDEDVYANPESLLKIEEIIVWLVSKRVEYQSKIKATQDPTAEHKSTRKIKWLGKPSQFGYLFIELEKNGFIELPKSKGVGSPSKLAELCMEAFNINTTIGTLKKEMSPKTNSLEIPNRTAFQIPDIETLS